MRYAVRSELGATGLVVLLGVVMPMLDTTIVNVALGTLARGFRTTFADVQWVATAYLLAMSLTVPVTGWAIGRFGVRNVWLVSLVLFVAGSALCAAAWSLWSLVVFRAVQGLGGGLLQPAGQVMLAQAAGKERLGRAMSLISVPAMLVPVLGPPLGGLIVQGPGWRWLFLVNVPVCAVALLAAFVLLPRESGAGRGRGQRLDVPGLALLSPGLVAFVYGLSEVGDGGALPHPALWIGVALIACFVLRSLRGTSLVDLRLFRDRAFTAAVLALACYSAAMSGFTVLVPLYSQLAEGGTVLDAGLLLAPLGVGAALTMPLAGKLADSRGPRGVAAAGVVLVVAGIAAFPLFGGGFVAMFGLGLGHGLVATPVMAAAYRTLERAAIPAATTLSTIALRLAAPFGVALLTVLLQVFAGAGAARPFEPAFWVAAGLAAVSLLPIVGSKVWRGSSSAPA
ncbi:DHA2 family efflux MFS transporter permease subunit [Nonomuraea gerenzanensis]|nr:DHA2 family efflux MFS transporter permease subunit [Nonomuraea gerenzanensis]UBU11105.1 DHA2 family efflux MFS transporter permease subunit [Nonomuraea gerenzanensis]